MPRGGRTTAGGEVDGPDRAAGPPTPGQIRLDRARRRAHLAPSVRWNLTGLPEARARARFEGSGRWAAPDPCAGERR